MEKNSLAYQENKEKISQHYQENMGEYQGKNEEKYNKAKLF